LRIFAKIYRELKDTSVNETDIIEYIGEALDFLQVSPLLEKDLAFLYVENFETDLPNCLQYVLQIAKHNTWSKKTSEQCFNNLIESLEKDSVKIQTCDTTIDGVPLDCKGSPIGNTEYAFYRPTIGLTTESFGFIGSNTYTTQFSPVLLSNKTFYKSIVYEDKNYLDLYNSSNYEYTIIGNVNKKFRFNFKEGLVAVSYLKRQVDEETGYPLIPDNISAISAITYYVKWKITEYHFWNNRQGSDSKIKYFEKKWLKYVKQAKNHFKMPKTIDEHYNLMKQSLKIVPDLKKYSKFFND
jgi:hypothetical protein